MTSIGEYESIFFYVQFFNKSIINSHEQQYLQFNFKRTWITNDFDTDTLKKKDEKKK